MKKGRFLTSLIMSVLFLGHGGANAQSRNWPPPSSPALAGTEGYVDIAGAAIPRDPKRSYKALFDATTGPEDPAKPLPALMRVARQINGLRGAQVPPAQIRFVMIMHKAATDALYTHAAYRRKYHVDNPNIALIEVLSKAGVRLLVCGQYLAGADIPKADLVEQAEVAESATLVIMSFANDGYAILYN